MKDIIKQNLNDEFYIQTFIERVIFQRNEALNTVAVLETEVLKANSVLQKLVGENKQLKEKLINQTQEVV